MSENSDNQETAPAVLQKQLETLEAEKAELRRKLDEATNRCTAQEEQIDTLRRAAGATCEALQKVDDLTRELHDLHNQNEQLKSSLAISQKQLKDAEKELDIMGSDLDNELHNRKLLKEERRKAAELETQLNDQKKATTEALKRYERATPELRRVQATLAANHKLVSDLPETLKGELTALIETADQMALDPDLGPGPYLQLQQIREHATQLQGVLNTRTELLYLHTGQLSPSPEPVDLAPFIDKITDSISERCKSSNVFFAASRSTDIKGTVLADASKTRRVLTDLLEHALEVSPRGRIGLQILQGDEPNQVCFRLSYSGLADDTALTGGLSNKASLEMTPAETRININRRYTELLGGTLAMEDKTPALLRLTLPMPPAQS